MTGINQPVNSEVSLIRVNVLGKKVSSVFSRNGFEPSFPVSFSFCCSMFYFIVFLSQYLEKRNPNT